MRGRESAAAVAQRRKGQLPPVDDPARLRPSRPATLALEGGCSHSPGIRIQRTSAAHDRRGAAAVDRSQGTGLQSSVLLGHQRA